MQTLNIDIETFSSVDIKKSGLYKYVQSPDFEILMIAYSFDGGEVQLLDLTQSAYIPAELDAALTYPSVTKKAYNAAFEWYALSKWLDFDEEQRNAWLPQWQCTMLHGLYCGYTAGLEATGKAIGLPQDKQKLTTGKALIKYFCVPCKPTKVNGGRVRNLPHHEPDKWNLFKAYCCQDVTAEMEIDRRLSGFPVPPEVQQDWELDQVINARGVAVDRELIQGALGCADIATSSAMDEARILTGLDNPKSRAQMLSWLNERGAFLENLQKETVELALEGVLPQEVRRALELWQEISKTSISKYSAMETAECEDGRVRGSLQFYGANRTGRWAGRIVQVQNLPRTYLYGDRLDWARTFTRASNGEALRALYGSVPDTLSQLIRTTLVPAPGKVFVDADFSAIEARVIAWLAGEEWVLQVFRSHGRIYEATAAQMFGIPLERIAKGNPEYDYRQKGKVATLALGYQGSTGALVKMHALEQGLTMKELPDIVSRWRNANPTIVRCWNDIEQAAIQAVETGRTVSTHSLVFAREADIANNQDFMTILLPSGRKLYYAKPHLGVNQWGEKALQYYGMNQTSKKWQVDSTYGGRLTENCIGEGTLVLTRRGFMPIEKITDTDILWDGMEWVTHGGLVCKGNKEVLNINGVLMTPEHLVLTKEGWKNASSCEGYYRSEVALPDSYCLCRVGREKIVVESAMRVSKTFTKICFQRIAKVCR